MTPTLTVVIPALNEAERLPVLLGLLARQTRQPHAVVVADAGSTDGTREAAESRGALVVPGGMPAAGRNAGAAVATTDLLLFLDADCEPALDWIEQGVEEFEARDLSVAAGQVEPIERTPGNILACDVVNMYLQLMQYVAPHAPGFCILVRREVHERIGGFDETIVLAEDHDYVQRAAELGKFRVLRNAPMRTSMRRLEKEGLLGLAFKYLYSEMYAVTGTPIRKIPFEYEFAAFDHIAVTRPDGGPGVRRWQEVPLDLELLRGQLDRLAEPLTTLSDDLLERLGLLVDEADAATGAAPIVERLRAFEPDEVRQLMHYVKHRLRVAQRMRPIVLRRVRRAGDRAWRKFTDPLF